MRVPGTCAGWCTLARMRSHPGGPRTSPNRWLWPLLAACHPEPTLAVTTVTTALALAAGRTGLGGLAVAGAVLTGQLSVGWSNDWIDAARDRAVGRHDKPAAQGLIDPALLRRCAFASIALACALSFLSGWRAALAHLAALGLAWAYNGGLKSTRASVVPYSGAFALLPIFVTLGLPGHPLPQWWAVTAGALLGGGAHFANVLPDLDDDAATGVRGLPHRLGAARARQGAAIMLLAATSVLALGPGRPGVLSIGAVALAAALTLVGLDRGGRTAFRVVLVVAAIDVVVLLARGSSLT